MSDDLTDTDTLLKRAQGADERALAELQRGIERQLLDRSDRNWPAEEFRL